MKSTMVKKKKILYSSCIMHQKLFKGSNSPVNLWHKLKQIATEMETF